MSTVFVKSTDEFLKGRGCWTHLLEKQLDAAVPGKKPTVTKTGSQVTITWDVALSGSEIATQQTIVEEHDTRIPWQTGMLATPKERGYSILAGYNAAGGISIGSSWTDLTWDTMDRKDTGYEHSLGTPEITIIATGDYEIQAEVSVDQSSGSSRTQAESRFVRNGVFMPGTKGFMYSRNSAQGGASCSVRVLRSLDSGDVIKVQCIRQSGNGPLQTHPHGCRVFIKKVG